VRNPQPPEVVAGPTRFHPLLLLLVVVVAYGPLIPWLGFYWGEIALLGDITFTLDDRPNDASERLPFVEGYAHVGIWDDAVNLSQDIVDKQPGMWLTVCRTWLRLERSVPDTGSREEALEEIYRALPCDEARAEE